LESVDPPWQGEYIWQWFWELHNGRQAGMSGPLPITWEAIKAWSELRHIELDSWELFTIKALDGKYLEEVGKKNDGPSQSSNRNRNPISKGRRR
jgi:hypothetical protein